jgi:hypothetical protein
MPSPPQLTETSETMSKINPSFLKFFISRNWNWFVEETWKSLEMQEREA